MDAAKKLVYASGFKENCNFDIDSLPDLEFTLGNQVFSVSPQHYIAKEEEVDPQTKKKESVCVLLIGQIDMPGDKNSAPMIILGTPFMRSNYIQFAHPHGDAVPHVCIHETCPEDYKAHSEKTSNVQRKARKVSAMAVDASGEIQRESEPVLRSQGDANVNILNTLSRIEKLERVPGKPLHGAGDKFKNWMQAMQGGRECSPTVHKHKYKHSPSAK